MEVPSYLLQKCPLVLENSFKITLVCQHLASIPFLCSLVPQHERNGPPNPNAPDPVSSDWDSPLFHSCVLDRNHKLHGADPSSSTHTATIWPTPTQHSTVQGQSHAYIHMQAPPPLGPWFFCLSSCSQSIHACFFIGSPSPSVSVCSVPPWTWKAAFFCLSWNWSCVAYVHHGSWEDSPTYYIQQGRAHISIFFHLAHDLDWLRTRVTMGEELMNTLLRSPPWPPSSPDGMNGLA